MQPYLINEPLSDYATKILQMYLSFPESKSFSAMDWKAGNGRFLHSITNKGEDHRLLYGVQEGKYDCERMINKYNFTKVSDASYLSEAKITNDVFSLMVVHPKVDDRLIHQVFETVDPYNMPNFEEEIRAKIMREEEEKERLQQQISEQIDFGSMNEDLTEAISETESNKKKEAEKLLHETPEEKEERISKKIRLELEKRIKAWRMAMKEQQKLMASMRKDAFLLARATKYLRPGGILMMITPKEFIDDTIAFKLVNQYEDIRILRLDDDEYKDYRKCVILAKKRKKPTREFHDLGRAISRTKERPYKSFGEIRKITADPEIDQDKYEKQVFRAKVDQIYGVLEPQVKPSYEVPACDIEEVKSFRVGPITGNEALQILKKSKLINAYQEKYSQVFNAKQAVTPTPLHKGHIMLLLTSGYLNGYIGTGPDQHLVKGSAIKDIREFHETDEDGDTRIVEREYYNIGVKILNGQGEFKKIM